jgi:hypothetical protein
MHRVVVEVGDLLTDATLTTSDQAALRTLLADGSARPASGAALPAQVGIAQSCSAHTAARATRTARPRLAPSTV